MGMGCIYFFALANSISGIVNKTKQEIAVSVNTAIVETYLNIGKEILRVLSKFVRQCLANCLGHSGDR